MLLQPFFTTLVVYREFNWALLPTLAAIITIFLIREPLLVIARQRFVWKTPHPETRAAKRYAAVELGILFLAGALLLRIWSPRVLALLGCAAGFLTVLALYLTLHNRQRAVWFQALSAAGLSSSVLAACLAISPQIPEWAWWIAGLHAVHYFGGVLVVHTRLEARIAARKPGSTMTPAFHRMRWEAGVILVFTAISVVPLFLYRKEFYAAALAWSALYHGFDLWRLHDLRALLTPFTTVGKRALAASLIFSILLVIPSL
jgi:hypothetical protein